MGIFNPEYKEDREGMFEANKLNPDMNRKLQKALEMGKEKFPDVVFCPNLSCQMPLNVKKEGDAFYLNCGACGFNKIVKASKK